MPDAKHNHVLCTFSWAIQDNPHWSLKCSWELRTVGPSDAGDVSQRAQKNLPKYWNDLTVFISPLATSGLHRLLCLQPLKQFQYWKKAGSILRQSQTIQVFLLHIAKCVQNRKCFTLWINHYRNVLATMFDWQPGFMIRVCVTWGLSWRVSRCFGRVYLLEECVTYFLWTSTQLKEIGGDGKRPYGITRNHREKPVYSEPSESLGRPAWPGDNLQDASLWWFICW